MVAFVAAWILAVIATGLQANADDANVDESKVPAYTLPDPLVMADGTPVTSAEQWQTMRRPELVALFQQHVYGAMPPPLKIAAIDVHERGAPALGGKGVRSQVTLYFRGDRTGPSMNVLIYAPASNNAERPAPAFVGCNFEGNHTVDRDPRIRLTTIHGNSRDDRGKSWLAKESKRGAETSRWPVEQIVARGYALVTVCYGDVDPDFDDGFKNGVHALFPEYQRRGDNWTSIGAWAWGLSRVLDYLETYDQIDAHRVAVIGHSRLGKTALWTGASDERFAMVISNDSGCGGAALARRRFGETVKRINSAFPHWFCTNHKQYGDNEEALPVDQHELIALIAPRPVYVASAEEDRWADPRGEFLACVAADPVYRLLGTEGLPTDQWPEVNHSVQGRIGYHIRNGKHEVTAFDWQQYLDFADKHLIATK